MDGEIASSLHLTYAEIAESTMPTPSSVGIAEGSISGTKSGSASSLRASSQVSSHVSQPTPFIAGSCRLEPISNPSRTCWRPSERSCRPRRRPRLAGQVHSSHGTPRHGPSNQGRRHVRSPSALREDGDGNCIRWPARPERKTTCSPLARLLLNLSQNKTNHSPT